MATNPTAKLYYWLKANKMTYDEHLASDHWQDVRRRYWSSNLPKMCEVCGQTIGLQLHHRSYKRLGHERLQDIVLLCRSCHDNVHDMIVKTLGTNEKCSLWGAARWYRNKLGLDCPYRREQASRAAQRRHTKKHTDPS